MKNLKKKALMAGSYLAVAAIAVGGTMAYLTDSDDDVNVMTLGKVQIEQHEYERALNEDGSYKTDTIDNTTSYVLQEFTQNKPLLPIVGDPNEPGSSEEYAGWDETTVRMSQVDSYGGMQVFAGKNAQDKFITVENTGRSDAYVRTLVAIEIGSTDGALIRTASRATANIDKAGEDDPWLEKTVGTVSIDDNNYRVVELVYKGALRSSGYLHEDGVLPAGETTYPSLSQIYLKHNTTNEDIEAIDGNDNGLLDVLVLSQAVQTDGFTDAETALDKGFGAANAENVKVWFEGVDYPVLVDSAEELEAALAEGGNITLTEDIELVNRLVIEKDVSATINLNGKDLILPDGDSINNYGTMVKGSLTIEGNGNVTVQGTYGIGTPTSGGDLTINGGTYTSTGTYMIGCFGGTVTINGGTFNGNYCILNNFDGYTGTVVVNDGTFSITNDLGDETAAEFLGDVIDNR